MWFFDWVRFYWVEEVRDGDNLHGDTADFTIFLHNF